MVHALNLPALLIFDLDALVRPEAGGQPEASPRMRICRDMFVQARVDRHGKRG
jgi:hypothetical protein